MTITPSDVRRFWNKVDVRDEASCWLWKASVMLKRGGYGQFMIRCRVVKAHRFSYELVSGPLAAEIFVCHRCDNPPCVNPAHLFGGTPKDNSLDMASKGRGRKYPPRPPRPGYAKGERNSASKVTADDIIVIRSLRSAGFTYADIGRRFGIHNSQVMNIISRKHWKHVA